MFYIYVVFITLSNYFVITECSLLIHFYLRDLDSLAGKNRTVVVLPIDEVLQTLNDLITYFQLPDAELEHEEKQIKLRSLKNRQNLFKQEVSFLTSYTAGRDKPTLSLCAPFFNITFSERPVSIADIDF